MRVARASANAEHPRGCRISCGTQTSGTLVPMRRAFPADACHISPVTILSACLRFLHGRAHFLAERSSASPWLTGWMSSSWQSNPRRILRGFGIAMIAESCLKLRTVSTEELQVLCIRFGAELTRRHLSGSCMLSSSQRSGAVSEGMCLASVTSLLSHGSSFLRTCVGTAQFSRQACCALAGLSPHHNDLRRAFRANMSGRQHPGGVHLQEPRACHKSRGNRH